MNMSKAEGGARLPHVRKEVGLQRRGPQGLLVTDASFKIEAATATGDWQPDGSDNFAVCVHRSARRF